LQRGDDPTEGTGIAGRVFDVLVFDGVIAPARRDEHRVGDLGQATSDPGYQRLSVDLDQGLVPAHAFPGAAAEDHSCKHASNVILTS
jgi:hypothetical protein